MNVTPLFSIPIASVNLSEINSEDILNELKSIKYNRNGNNNSSMSDTDFLLDGLGFKSLKESICNKFDEYVYSVLNFKDIEFYMCSSWSNLHLKNDSGQIHYHPNSLYSAVYYPQDTDENSGMINFHCPESVSTYITTVFDPDIGEYNLINSKTWSFSAKKGDLFIFPSHINHSVSTNRSDQERYSIACNFWIKKYVDTKRSRNLVIK